MLSRMRGTKKPVLEMCSLCGFMLPYNRILVTSKKVLEPYLTYGDRTFITQ